jgi:hypothetical protein
MRSATAMNAQLIGCFNVVPIESSR